jgi:Tetratricopeptide repeat
MQNPTQGSASHGARGPELDIGARMLADRGMVRGTSGGGRDDKRGARRAGLLVSALVILLPLARAAAQPSPPPAPAVESPRPWAAGVSEREQALALEIYVAGNTEFAESRFAQALARYREAIAHWDHPAIRFNMAVCLINLGQPIEAREQLERSLAHGVPALGAEAHAQAITYRKLLDAQLTHVTISCPEPGAQVTLDGKPLFTGPGSATRYLLPGAHQVVAAKPGMQAALHALSLTAGGTTALELRPTLALPALPQMERRWATWKPWAVMGGGGALLGLGALSYFSAKSSFEAYDRGVAERCPSGCSAMMLAEYDELTERKASAERKQLVAFSLFAAGGGAVVAGVVGLLLNQPRVRPDENPAPLTLSPVAGGATVSTAWSF